MKLGALFYDYGVDAALSFLDEAFGGLIGFDVGDFIAAIIMFQHEKKHVGFLPATFVAWEATGFFPASLIPGVGTAIEIITNLTPTAFITRLLFDRTAKAKKQLKQLEEIKGVLAEYDAKPSKKNEEAARKALRDGRVVDARRYAETALHNAENQCVRILRRYKTALQNGAYQLSYRVENQPRRKQRIFRRELSRLQEDFEDVEVCLGRIQLEEANKKLRGADEILTTLESKADT